MLTIYNVLLPDNSRTNLTRPYPQTQAVDGSHLLALPGLIDPHVHFRVPGLEEKEDWLHAARAALKGGYTTVFDMPNTKPATTTSERLLTKRNIIDQQLAEVGIPLNYQLFFGADKNQFDQIAQVKDEIIGIKVFMGASTGDLLMDDLSSLHAIYALARAHNLLIALHAEDELTIQANAAQYAGASDYKYHSVIRSPAAAAKAVELVIELAELYQVRSYILHVSTRAELALIAAAKQRGVPLIAETCPHYLFLDDSCYAELAGRAKMNPPLRSREDQEYLWEAVRSGIIDTLASDHAPHQLQAKAAPLCKCPSGVPGIETSLPLLLTAWQAGKISLARIIELTQINPQRIFNLAKNDDLVLVDCHNYRELTDEQLATKCKWSPFSGMRLTGFPRYVYLKQQLFDCQHL